eukprot:TRINITY_DN57389_c0_g1_i1.p1 TRINITY_DN57389_c0_g1~~TRINITY_DN57389_c0_g1_i1.p1  ORF type:complete len:1135 (-),score=281.36 TRINITY_DN57389_c0_g1_i1:70-3474(-)
MPFLAKSSSGYRSPVRTKAGWVSVPPASPHLKNRLRPQELTPESVLSGGGGATSSSSRRQHYRELYGRGGAIDSLDEGRRIELASQIYRADALHGGGAASSLKLSGNTKTALRSTWPSRLPPTHRRSSWRREMGDDGCIPKSSLEFARNLRFPDLQRRKSGSRGGGSRGPSPGSLPLTARGPSRATPSPPLTSRGASPLRAVSQGEEYGDEGYAAGGDPLQSIASQELSASLGELQQTHDEEGHLRWQSSGARKGEPSPTWVVFSESKTRKQPKVPSSTHAAKVYGRRPHPFLRDKVTLELIPARDTPTPEQHGSVKMAKPGYKPRPPRSRGGSRPTSRAESVNRRSPFSDESYNDPYPPEERDTQEIFHAFSDSYQAWLHPPEEAQDKKRESKLMFALSDELAERFHPGADGISEQHEHDDQAEEPAQEESSEEEQPPKNEGPSWFNEREMNSKEESWVAVFNKLQEHNDIHIDDIPRALELAGFVCLRQDWIKEFTKDRQFNTLGLDEYLAVVKKYQQRQHEEYSIAFQECDRDGSGCVESSELAEILKRFGIEPMSHVLEEVIAEVDIDGKGSLDLGEFKTLMDMLNLREGFTKSEYDELLQVFEAFDRDGSEELATQELATLLNFLGFAWGPQRTQAIIEDVDVDESGSINKKEFLVCMRKIRNEELQLVARQIRESDEDGSGTVAPTEMATLLKGLGYDPWDTAVVEEALEEAGLGQESELDLGQIWRLLKVYRALEGFSKADVACMDEAFREHDKDNSGELSNLEAPRALRDLGYTATFEIMQMVIAKVDLNDSGQMDMREFRKMIRMLEERELLLYRETFQTQATGQKRVALQTAIEMLQHLKFDVNNAHLFSGSKQATATMFDLQAELNIIDEDAFVKCCCWHSRDRREVYRKNGGWDEDEVKEFREIFDRYDSKQNGRIVKKDSVRLVEDVFPGLARDREMRPKLQEMMKSVQDPSGSLGFRDFVQLLRLFREFQDLERAEKEQNAIKVTGFSPTEVQEFRDLFLDTDDGIGLITFEDFRGMIHMITPMGDNLSTELQKMFLEFTKKKIDPRHDAQPQADFPEFLLLMKHLMDVNFANLSEKTKAHDGGANPSPQPGDSGGGGGGGGGGSEDRGHESSGTAVAPV